MAEQKQRVGWLTIASNVAFGLAAIVAAYSLWSISQQNHALLEALEGSRGPTPPEDRIGPGDQLANLPLIHVDGEKTTLPKLARQVKVLAVLTTTCPFCRDSLPAWNDLARELEGHAIGFAGISLHDADRTRTYVRENEITWPVLVLEPSTVAALGVTSVPRTFILRDSGTIDEVIRGRFAADDGERTLQMLGFRASQSP